MHKEQGEGNPEHAKQLGSHFEPQNMYEGIRVLASFIFYDVPNY